MAKLLDQLSQYASYHRDRRNVATHLVGIPMIVVSVSSALSRSALPVAGLSVSLALIAALACLVYYFRLDRQLAWGMAAFLALSLLLGAVVAKQTTAVWLLATGVLFAGGWLLQFVGHAYERRKPAFLDDLTGLATGPLFIVAELAFSLGLRDGLRRELERRVGPPHSGQQGPDQRSR